MTRQARQILLAAIAILLTCSLVLFLSHRDLVRDPVPPSDLDGLARWVARHPADWQSAAALTEEALDSSLPRRVELWHASFAVAQSISPRRPAPAVSFVRSGLFHWYELSPLDRQSVLEAASTLMRNPTFFGDLHRALWELTHDFAWLRRNAPGTLDSLDALRTIAAENGLFREYRELRTAMVRQRLADFEATRSKLDAHELPSLLPRRIDKENEPLVRRILEELKQRSFVPERFTDPTTAMIEYAIRHRLPLDDLAPFLESDHGLPPHARARLALALGNPDTARNIELSAAASTSPEWGQYHLERAELEARRGNVSVAEGHLAVVMLARRDPEVLAAAQRIATMVRNDAAALQFGRELRDLVEQPRAWTGTCGPNELCSVARTVIFTNAEPVTIGASVVQSDQIPPYLEIHTGDALVAEGEVATERRFTIALPGGVHRIQVHLVNPRMGNGTQRRVRLD